MHGEQILHDITVVVVLGAVLAWCAHALRQPIILGYILCGVIAGPGGFALVSDVEFVDAAGKIGVTLLLFLAGVTLHPNQFYKLFRQTAWVTAGTGFASFAVAAVFVRLWGFGWGDSLLAGAALMYSSTILVIKLLPTTTLHQRHMGATCIAVLIAQDIVAVTLLLYIGPGRGSALGLTLLPLKVALLLGGAFIFEQYILRKMMAHIDRIHEVLYLLSLGWCLGLAMLAHQVGLSIEMGAFVAGIALARSPLSFFLSEGLKPFRDFFLVLFFFVLGARLDLGMIRELLLPALLLGGALLVLKPWTFYKLFQWKGEAKPFAREAGLRLGQASEFSLIIAAYAAVEGAMTDGAAQLVQLTAIITMAVSSYIVVLRCPTPVASNKRLQRD